MVIEMLPLDLLENHVFSLAIALQQVACAPCLAPSSLAVRRSGKPLESLVSNLSGGV